MGKTYPLNKRLLLSIPIIALLLSRGIVFAEPPKYPLFKNNTGKTVIERISRESQWLSDFMIISPKGTVIIVDAYDTSPKFIDSVKPDIICITHMQHQEHVESYPSIHMTIENCIRTARQLDPQIIIPTHRNTYSIDELGSILKLPVEQAEKIITISKTDLNTGGKKMVELKNTLE